MFFYFYLGIAGSARRNQRTIHEGSGARRTFDGPMLTISSNLAALENANEVINKVLMYLLGREDEPAVAEVLHHFYQRSVHIAKQWIVIGQQHGVIQESVDSERTAEMFVLLSFGLRVRSSFLKAPVFTLLKIYHHLWSPL